ncbi:MAG: intradiol ring-cleavage dioxygenase [Alphaproteobacteria bacterium]|nr:intradiol ring-cleavage dioxygenase [Alphaproteobacteria bacterium]
MTEYDSKALTKAVVKRLSNTPNKRLRRILASLVTHMHDFVRDVRLTEAEWAFAIDFLTRTGQKCDDKRQEFILLSDTTGVSMLVDFLNHANRKDVTPSTVEGPFWIDGSPWLKMGDSILLDGKGEPCHISGKVTDPKGKPIKGAVLDVWQGNADGFYALQQPGIQPEYNLRGRFKTGADGSYAFRSCKPVPYPVPTDGPVGAMLKATHRHPMRPPHVHFIIEAEGYAPLTTHLFPKGGKYLDSDAVFGVKNRLIVPFKKRTDAAEARALGFDKAPYYKAEYDFTLQPAR